MRFKRKNSWLFTKLNTVIACMFLVVGCSSTELLSYHVVYKDNAFIATYINHTGQDLCLTESAYTYFYLTDKNTGEEAYTRAYGDFDWGMVPAFGKEQYTYPITAGRVKQSVKDRGFTDIEYLHPVDVFDCEARDFRYKPIESWPPPKRKDFFIQRYTFQGLVEVADRK